MKKSVIVLSVLIALSTKMYAQYNADSFAGTWVYQSQDTVFTIKLQRVARVMRIEKQIRKDAIVGGYANNTHSIRVTFSVKTFHILKKLIHLH